MIESKRVVNAFLKNAFDFSSVQFNFPDEVAEEIRTWSLKNIPDNLLATDGRESEIHVTIKYGIHIIDFTEVRNFFINEKAIKITLDKITTFEADDYDVIKIDIISPDLHRLNRIISNNFEVTNTYPTYIPHCTVCYIKKSCGISFEKRTDFEGRKVILDTVLFSGKDNRKTEFKIPV